VTFDWVASLTKGVFVHTLQLASFLPRDLRSLTLRTDLHFEPTAPARSRPQELPVIALGGGVTLAAVLNVLHQGGIPCYALCPQTDFVRRSRWYRALPTALPNPRPPDLEALLESLEIESGVLLPCSDDWLRAVATLPAPLASRFPSSTSGPSVEVLIDKWRFARLLERFGIPHPRTQLISSREQFAALPDCNFDGAILKPLSSVHFASRHGVKGYLVENRRQAEAVIDKLELPIMLQEFIPGPPNAGYFLDGFRDRTGHITAIFARRRLRMYPSKLGNSTFIESLPLRALHGAAILLEYLLEKISYRGVFSAEFKFDERDRAFKLIEINARPWWYVEFASRCGVDVCTMAYRDALGLPVDKVRDYEVGRRCIFALNDLRAWRERGQNRGAGPWSLFRSWLRSDSTPFHWNDPAPALSHLAQTVASLVRASLHTGTPIESKLEAQPSTQREQPHIPPSPRVQDASLVK
jgi:D-aspartate ligase